MQPIFILPLQDNHSLRVGMQISNFEYERKKTIEQIVQTFRLTTEQKNATITNEGPIRIIAEPGSGKTLVLVLKVLYLVKTSQATANQILITSFNKNAVEEIKKRVIVCADKLGMNDEINGIQIKTIDSLCHAINDSDPYQTGFRPKVLDELNQRFFILTRFEKIFQGTVFARDIRLDSLISSIDKWTQLINKIGCEVYDTKALSKLEHVTGLMQIYHNYERELKIANKIDYSIQLKYALAHLKNGERKDINYRYIIIDEYQDINRLQNKLLFELAKKYMNICVMGDPCQAIYAFRGSYMGVFEDFCREFERFNPLTLRLSKNFRSHPGIIKFISEYRSKMYNSINKFSNN